MDASGARETEPDAIWTAAVIEQNHRWLLAFFYGTCGNRTVAEDLVQDTLSEAYRKRGEYKSDQPFGAWLRGIARNLLKREAERHQRAPLLMGNRAWEYAEQAAAALEQRHVDTEYEVRRVAALRDCISKLATKARSLVEGRYRENLSVEAVARRTGMAPDSVPVALFRARTTLSECIKKKMNDHGYSGSIA